MELRLVLKIESRFDTWRGTSFSLLPCTHLYFIKEQECLCNVSVLRSHKCLSASLRCCHCACLQVCTRRSNSRQVAQTEHTGSIRRTGIVWSYFTAVHDSRRGGKCLRMQTPYTETPAEGLRQRRNPLQHWLILHLAITRCYFRSVVKHSGLYLDIQIIDSAYWN